MQSLLDKFIQPATFRPGSSSELFALRLAQRLDDAKAIQTYVRLTEEYSESQLLCAYRRALRVTSTARWQAFRDELRKVHSSGSSETRHCLLAIRIERRTVAIAVFKGTHLEYADSRQLSSSHDKAFASAERFVGWILESFEGESAALESVPSGHDFHREKLHGAVCAELRRRGLPLWDIPRPVLFDAYGQPPLTSRNEMRKIAVSIWPTIEETHAKVFVQDATALGLYVQTERQFMT